MAHQSTASTNESMAGMQGMHGDMQGAIATALNCHTVCTQKIQHCLQHGGQHVEKQHMTLMLDCAQICITSADFMCRESQMHRQVCGVCAEVCEACAKSCDNIEDADGAMKACAEACRRCAEHCRQMSQVSS
jgi:hypothetical protein